MGVYTGSPALPLLLAGDIPASATDWAGILAELNALSTAWSTWTPTLTNLTLGNGTVVARYRQVGKTVDYRFKFTLGSTSAVGTDPRFSPPATPSGTYAANDLIGAGQLFDATGSTYPAVNNWNGTDFRCTYWDTTPVLASVTATVPFTWTTSDRLHFWGTYEAA